MQLGTYRETGDVFLQQKKKSDKKKTSYLLFFMTEVLVDVLFTSVRVQRRKVSITMHAATEAD